jgi:DNA helicase-2/ATP-dependent DNA helicase PcrA
MSDRRNHPMLRGISAESIDVILDLNKELNDEQFSSAVTTEGPVMVIAGAGTGKTKVLIHRVATLLVKGVHPANILVSTFTNKAAAEIKDRLELMVGENAQYVNAGTFHSLIFKKILQKFPESKYLNSLDINMFEAAILDDEEASKLMKDAIKELPESDLEQVKDNEWSYRDFFTEMSKYRAVGEDVNDAERQVRVSSSDIEFNKILIKLWRSYNASCRGISGIDFDDILLFCNKMLDKEPHIAEALASEFKYLMLDEYQDTNRVQMSIMDKIAVHHKNIFTVGDEKQSIYRFRMADIKVILSFKKRYPNAIQIDMINNYRSYSRIMDYSNACADAMTQRLNDGQLRYNKQVEESPVLQSARKSNSVQMVEFKTSLDEAKTIARAIKRDIKCGVDPSEIAVLYRSRMLKSNLEKELIQSNIQYNLIGDTAFFGRAEVKDAIAMVRFVFRPWDSLAGIRVLKAMKIGVSDAAAKKSMSSQGLNVSEYLKQVANTRLRGKAKGEDQPDFTAAAKKAQPFIGLCSAIKESLEYGDDAEYIKDVLVDFWEIYFKPKLELSAKGDASIMEERLSNVGIIFDGVEKSIKDGKSMDDIIEDLAFMVDNNNSQNNDDDLKINMMTMHASKGLEFDNVYVIGYDDEISHKTSSNKEPEKDDIEEERRLFYVGMTRAKKKLAISYATERMVFGEYCVTQKSPFLQEIESRLGVKTMVISSVPDAKKPVPSLTSSY